MFLLLYSLFDVESFTSINCEASSMLSSRTEVGRQPGRRYNVVSAAAAANAGNETRAPKVIIVVVSHIIERRIGCQPEKPS